MSKPTNAQIAAARKAHNAFIGNVINMRVPTEDDENAAVAAALTAAAEVGDFCAECGATLPSHKQDCKSGLPEVDSLRAQCSFCGGMVEMSDSGIIAATIERCAQVADDLADKELDAGQAALLRRAAAAIRALADKPQPDHNIIYPGKDLTNVFPEEGT